MNKGDRNEHEGRRHENQRETRGGRRPQHEKIEDHDVPQRRKSAKPVVRRFHSPIREIERRTGADRGANGRGDRRIQEAGAPQRHKRRDHIVEKVDDEVERDAVDEGRRFSHSEMPRQRSVDGVDDERRAKPGEHRRKVAVRREEQRDQAERRAARREQVDRKADEARRRHEARRLEKRDVSLAPPPRRAKAILLAPVLLALRRVSRYNRRRRRMR